MHSIWSEARGCTLSMGRREEDATRNGQVPNTEGTVKVICWVQFLGCCGKPTQRSFWGDASGVREVTEVDRKEEGEDKEELAPLWSVYRFMYLY